MRSRGLVRQGRCFRGYVSDHARGQVSRFEYPGGRPEAKRSADGLGTDGIVGATAPTGLRQGVRVGRVAAQAAGSFNTRAANGTVQGISYRYRRIVQHVDGHGYYHNTSRQKEAAKMRGTCDIAILPALGDGVSCELDK